MLSLISRSFTRPRFRWLNATTRYLAQSTTSNSAQNVYMNEDECLVIKWNDGNIDEFPYVYLREHCRCSACYTDERKSRTMYSPKEVDINTTAQSAVWNTGDDQLEVKWVDGHASHYSLEWLKHLRYRAPGEGQPPGVLRNKIKLWGSEMLDEGNLPTFQFDKLINDEEELYKWLVTLVSRTGIARIQNAPKESGQLKILGEKVGYLATIVYGKTSPTKVFSNKHVIGYTDGHVPPHSDFPYIQTAPLVSMLHCIEQTKGEGGVNLWVDAFHAANLLREENPESFQILATTPILFRNFANKKTIGKIYSKARHSLIRVDHENKLKQVLYSDEFRATHMPLEPKLMKSFYKAYFRFSQLLSDNKTSFWYKMEAGEIMTFNNYRIVHARSGYKDQSNNVRFLELALIDEDCVHSKIRFLADKQGLQSPVD